MTKPFNPLDMHNLAASIVTQLEETDPHPLHELKKFLGAGIYALYYTGPFPAYSLLTKRNTPRCTEPIYIGKAVPSGGRRGITVETHTTALYKRLNDHAKSIRAAENLDISHFRVQWLVMEDIWIPLGESAMIRRHTPVWNALLDGFGNHDPGKGRINGIRSKWDTLHPGRSWAEKFPSNPESPAAIAQEVTEYLRSRLA
ncbi:Eco29kI restriction endonuclease (plasmid) [Corynebacterium mustelae]|uniref:Eco29kI restriction endonuclease n=1 Tax=Corynebacterium mustelae TaxID=571915 RepID=A0A0G3H8D5_9CORY|nr:Eco29kI family restriction endonuclease [Corynebacterium mustelae]AKK07412.1 Eco29kI restriction endonuclease [Corynebacterium mustelae]